MTPRAGRPAQRRKQQPISHETGCGPHADAERRRRRGKAGRVDEVEGEEAVEDVEQEVGGLECQQQANHVAAADGGERVAHRPSERRRGLRLRAREPNRRERERQGHDRESRERTTPADTDVRGEHQQNRPSDIAERAGEGPAGHVPRPLRRLRVHQRRLRERDERAGCGVADHQRREQEPEAAGGGAQGRRRGEREPAHDHDQSPARGVADDTDQRVERAPDEPRDREDEPDLGIAQAEVVPNRRPRGRAGAADELVEQLDREQRRDERRSATTSGSGSAAN